MTSVKNYLQTFSNSLVSMQSTLEQGQKPTPESLEQFQKNQIEFFRQITNLSDSDIQNLDQICTGLKGVIEKMRLIETRFTLEKKNGIAEEIQVKVLRSIADTFRFGDEDKALDTFTRCISDREDSLAGDVYGCLWKVRGRPDYGDFGRISFNNRADNAKSSTLQKALAVEMAMIGVICKALEKGQTERAYAEFHELPSRMKEAILRLMAQKQLFVSDLEAREKSFFVHTVETKAKIGELNAYQDSLEKSYSHFSDSDHLRMLQQEFQQKENIFFTTLKQTHDTKWELLELLQTTHATALQKLQKMQAEQNTQLLHQIATLQNHASEQNHTMKCFEEKIRELELENLQLKTKMHENGSLEKKNIEVVVDPEEVPIGQFAEFVKRECPSYNIENVMKFIEQGKSLVEKIQNGQAALIPIKERKKEMVSLVWYMLYFAVCKKQGFRQGTIVFRDPGHAIAKFFLECGHLFIYPRPSTHFTDRLLPTFFAEKYRTTSYGIDILQDNQTGLPGNKQTVLFSPIESQDGLDWTFFKPENWGFGDSYQKMGHAWDYFTSRWAHLMGNPNGPHDRKEHILPDTRTAFERIYFQAVSGDNANPDGVKKFGIAGMKAVFEGMLNDSDLSEDIKVKMRQFLSELQSKYDYLDTRKGHEAILGSSFILGSIPQENMHQSMQLESLERERLKDAQMRVKNAVHKSELAQGLAILSEKAPLTIKKLNFGDGMNDSFRTDLQSFQSNLDKNLIFKALHEEMQNFNVQLLVDGQQYENVEAVYEQLSKTSEDTALRLMAMMQKQTAKNILLQLEQWFAQPSCGVALQQMPDVTIDLQTGPNPTMEMTLLFRLVTIDATKPVYDKVFFENIEGKMKIDSSQQTNTISARVKKTSSI